MNAHSKHPALVTVKKSPFDSYERLDSYVNQSTGHGGAHNRIEQTQFQGHTYIGRYEERELHRSDWPAQKIIEEPVYDMFSNWIDWQEDKEAIPEDKLKEIEEWVERFSFEEVATSTGIMANKSGAGFAYFTFDDGATEDELRDPLNEARVSEIIRIDVVDKWDCLPLTTYDDPQHPKFREPETYRLILYGYRTQLSVEVHETRLARFESPIKSDQTTRARNLGANDGVLVPVYDELKRYGVTIQSVGSTVERFFVNTYKTKGVLERLASGDVGGVNNRVFDLYHNGHNENTIMLEHGEEYTREAAPLQGLAELIPTFGQVIAHASKLPLYKFWTEAGALGGDSHDGTEDDYHSVIRYRQKTQGKPFLNQLFKFLSLVVDFDPEKLKYNFNPLKEQTAIQRAEVMKTTFEAYEIMMNTTVLQPETVAENVFGGKEIDLTTMQVDMQEWIKQKEDDEADQLEMQKLVNEGMKNQDNPKPKKGNKENPDQLKIPE